MPKELGFETPLHKLGCYYWTGRDKLNHPVAVVAMKRLVTIELQDLPFSTVLSYI
jgi:hypothetical protein